MPELPEGETIARGLHALIQGRILEDASLLTPSILRAGATQSLPGRTVTHVSRRAKLLRLHLDNGGLLVFHLKMTGRVWVAGPGLPLPKHTHLVCRLDGGDRLVFEDTRRFGYCAVFGPARSTIGISSETSAPNPWTPAPGIWRGASAPAGPGSRPCSSTRPSSPASATSTPTSPSSPPASTRRASPPPSPKPGA
jgi:formamidopyrimidine-DNA glycosylase